MATVKEYFEANVPEGKDFCAIEGWAEWEIVRHEGGLTVLSPRTSISELGYRDDSQIEMTEIFRSFKAPHDERVLATIELDGDEGRGELFVRYWQIYCRRVSDGEEWDTQVEAGFTLEDAATAIGRSWGDPLRVWDLKWEIE